LPFFISSKFDKFTLKPYNIARKFNTKALLFGIHVTQKAAGRTVEAVNPDFDPESHQYTREILKQVQNDNLT